MPLGKPGAASERQCPSWQNNYKTLVLPIANKNRTGEKKRRRQISKAVVAVAGLLQQVEWPPRCH